MLENEKRRQGKNPDYRPLILDASGNMPPWLLCNALVGREIDEKGNVVKKVEQVRGFLTF